MYSGIQTFGESLTAWMEENNLTPSALAAYTRGTRDATISRLMHDQLDYQRCARYITELAESYPDIDEDTLRRLRISVDVNRYGKEMYLAKQNFFRMITGENEDGCAEYAKTDEFSERLLSWSGDMCFQFLCIGVGDVEPQRLLSDLCRRKNGVRIYDFFDRAYVGELTGLLAEILPIAFSPNYELYEIQGSRSAIMNNIMIAKREDGQQLLIVYDGGKYSSLDVSKETELFDFCRNILISRHHAPKKINCHFSYNSPEAYLDFLAHCLSLEKDKAIYHIKSEIGLEYVPVSILFENFTEWAKANDTRFLPFLDKLKEIFEKRYENILTKKEPYLLIQDVTDVLKQVKFRRSSKQLDSLMYSIKKLEEKLSVESDFGYGSNAVINCENNIARQIQFLLDTVPCIENGDFEENLKAMDTAVMNINSLLRKRIELKKR